MMPPECKICGKGLRESVECDIVYFKRTKKDKEWDKAIKESGLTGHPPYAVWFCMEHFAEAKKLENFTREEAMKKLRTLFK